MARDDTVGRGGHTRFKPGQSGNPKGRPKGSCIIKAAIEKAAMAPCIVTIGTRRQRMPNVEATVRNWFNRASKGDKSAEKIVADLLRPYLSGGSGEDRGPPDGQPAGGEGLADQDIINAWERDLLERKARIDGDGDE